MKKKLKYIIPSLITFVILGVIYYFNGLYPFGDNPLVQVDADYLYPNQEIMVPNSSYNIYITKNSCYYLRVKFIRQYRYSVA